MIEIDRLELFLDTKMRIDKIVDLAISSTPKLPPFAADEWAQIPLQALRIPSGWQVDYHQLFEIDPLPELFLDEILHYDFFKEDLLQMKCHMSDRLLDVGWYPSGNLVVGNYRLVVYEGDFSGLLLYEFITRDRLKLVTAIEQIAALISRSEL